MSKSCCRQSRAFILLTVICAALIALVFVARGQGAYADTPVLPSDVEIATQPVSTTVVYGEEEATLQVELNYDEVEASYFWYRSESPTATAMLIESGTAAKPSLKLTKVSDTGYYRCEITAINYNNNTYGTMLRSNTVYVAVLPKEIGVEASQTEFEYNGSWQTPELVPNQEEIVEGDTVKAYLEIESAPKNAGEYVGKIVLENENYVLAGEENVYFTITKAPLTIAIVETSVRAGRDYVLEITYEGFKGSDTPEDLDFTPTIPSAYLSIKQGGTYSIHAEGNAESDNYVITYANSNLYVDMWRLEESDIEGVTADAGGTFRPGSKVHVNIRTDTPDAFSFFTTFMAQYTIVFTEGGADGESFIFNLKDSGYSSFCLAVCSLDAEGKKQRIDNYSMQDGVLSVTLPAGQESTNFAVYYDYTLIIGAAGIVLLIAVIVLIALGVSRKRFKRAKHYYNTARTMADKYRNKW